MATLNIKGHVFNEVLARDSYNRRAMQYKNQIIASLSKLGLSADDTDIEVEQMAMKNLPASATWFINGRRCYYDYKLAKKYVDNMYVVYKVIDLEVTSVLEGRKPIEEFIMGFSEDDDLDDARIEAREILGVAPDSNDMDEIDRKYKELARKYHPDMPEGNLEMFKKINNAHKVIKRELR